VTLSSLDLSKDKVVTLSSLSTVLSSLTGYDQGVVLSFRAFLTDVAGNKKEGSPSSNTLIIDTGVPVDFTTGVVSVSGGEVESGYWNGSNSGLTVSVPIGNDVSLLGGTVEVEGRVGNGSYASLGSAVALSSLDLSKDKVGKWAGLGTGV